ncbi:hypothetical protein BH24ACT3_BH24ACT3_01980 [soil metagenome]
MLGVGLIALATIAGAHLYDITGDMDHARDLLERADRDVEAGRLDAAADGLRQAQAALNEANGVLYSSPSLQIAGFLPVVTQNLEALRDAVSITLELVNGGRRVLDAARPLAGPDGDLEVPLSDGAIPLDVLRDAQAELGATAAALPGGVERPGDGLLVGPVKDLRAEVYDEAIVRRDQFDEVGRALDLLLDMAGGNGSRRYLIAVANTAEMRGAGGMILSYGELLAEDGDFELGAFGGIDELLLTDPADVELPDDYEARWASFEISRLWRNATAGADFTLVAPVLEAMHTKATGAPVDGVIQVDPSGLAAILEGTGPVQVPGLGEVTAENVVALSLNEAYTLFPDRDQRQEVLGDIAEAVFDQLVTGDYDSLRPLAEALFEAVGGRHLLMPTTVGSAQSQVEFFDADGELPQTQQGDVFHLGVQNVSANKLDYYVESHLSLQGTRPAGDFGTIAAEITLSNVAPPAGTPEYVFGPFNEEQEAGLYRGIVSLYVPRGVELAGVSGSPTATAPAEFTEDGRPLLSYRVDLRPGETHVLVLELRLPPRPPGQHGVELVPQPRVRDTTTTVAVDLGDGRRITGQELLDRSFSFAAGREPRPTSGPLGAGDG